MIGKFRPTKKLLSFKLFLTALVCIALALPYFYPRMSSGFLIEMQSLGFEYSVVTVFLFLLLVFLYCKDLQRCLELISEGNRETAPRSVWLMFLIPYNFIEDFFIIHNLSLSIKNEAKSGSTIPDGGRYGVRSGIGWCAFQLLSLMPGVVGQISGIIALILWIVHWRFIRQIKASLQTFSSETSSEA